MAQSPDPCLPLANASPAASRRPAHGSRRKWLVVLSFCRDFHPATLHQLAWRTRGCFHAMSCDAAMTKCAITDQFQQLPHALRCSPTAHHLDPVANGETEVCPETDFVPVCANCHCMLHRGELLAPEDLEALMQKKPCSCAPRRIENSRHRGAAESAWTKGGERARSRNLRFRNVRGLGQQHWPRCRTRVGRCGEVTSATLRKAPERERRPWGVCETS